MKKKEIVLCNSISSCQYQKDIKVKGRFFDACNYKGKDDYLFCLYRYYLKKGMI